MNPTFVGFVALVILAAGGGCAPEPDPAAAALFHHRIIDPAPPGGKDCCTDVLMLGDINGDGRHDIAIGSEHAEGPGLFWYRYPTWEKRAIARGDFTTDGQLADIDGDGDLDIVTGTFSNKEGETLWFENVAGNGGEWRRHAVGKGYAHDVAVGDVNADGTPDVVTCDKKKLTLWLQVAPGVFQGQTILERPGEGIALADIDKDGRPDIVFGGSWLENPGPSPGKPWMSHPVAKQWPADTRVAVADMNGDGRLDVVLSVSEGEGPLKGPLSWFEAPTNPRTDSWIEHPIDGDNLEGAHSLQVADLDGDGRLDVVAAEMHTSKQKRVLVYLNKGGSFQRLVLSRKGSHNMRVADLDGDGDYDVVGKNYASPGRVIEMWENLTSQTQRWAYTSIDRSRPKSQQGKMGLVFTDVDRDGFTDVIAGAFWYRNPGGDVRREWVRALVADEGMDVYFAVAADGREYCSLVGIKDSTVYWLKAADAKATSWSAQPIGEIAKRGRTQGYVTAQLVRAKKPQLVFTRGKNLYALEVPDTPESAAWPLHRISTEVEEEGVAVGDLDGDGDLDIAAVGADGHHVVWLENPGSLSVQWAAHTVGDQIDSSNVWLDRIAIADLNRDGHLDIVATEERQDWNLGVHLYWFESPADPKIGKWDRHVIARHRSLNSMDIADVDRDGNVDIVVAEHTDQKTDGAPDNLAVIYLNRNGGRTWVPSVVERGPHSSHLGAKLADLDKDGVFEIVSIGWTQYQHVHLWKKTIPSFQHGTPNENSKP